MSVGHEFGLNVRCRGAIQYIFKLKHAFIIARCKLVRGWTTKIGCNFSYTSDQKLLGMNNLNGLGSHIHGPYAGEV